MASTWSFLEVWADATASGGQADFASGWKPLAQGRAELAGVHALPEWTGPFRVVRNPIYGGLLLAMAGATLASPSPWTIMGSFLSWFLIHFQTRLEEVHLLELHGATYRAYASRVGRFFPLVGRLSAA